MDRETRYAINKAAILVSRKRYQEARELLRSVDDPKAIELLEKINKVAPEPTNAFDFDTPLADQSSVTPMPENVQKWEYKVLMYFADPASVKVVYEDGVNYGMGHRPALHDHLNQLGRQGWIVDGIGRGSAVTLAKSEGGTIILRRPIP